jgi:hypothetical protein
MIESTKASKLLGGVRGETIRYPSELVIDFSKIQEINPLLVFEQGKGSKVVDSRIVIS